MVTTCDLPVPQSPERLDDSRALEQESVRHCFPNRVVSASNTSVRVRSGLRGKSLEARGGLTPLVEVQQG